jgi:hypothetical protein
MVDNSGRLKLRLKTVLLLVTDTQGAALLLKWPFVQVRSGSKRNIYVATGHGNIKPCAGFVKNAPYSVGVTFSAIKHTTTNAAAIFTAMAYLASP